MRAFRRRLIANSLDWIRLLNLARPLPPATQTALANHLTSIVDLLTAEDHAISLFIDEGE
jgi:hypothetical protein